MQSNWLDATLHLSPDELRTWDWMEAPMIGDEDLPVYEEDLTELEECGIITRYDFKELARSVEKIRENK